MKNEWYVPPENFVTEKKKYLVPEGRAEFRVVGATDELSKSSGQPQIKLELLITDNPDGPGVLYSYLPMTDKMAWKIREFLACVGLPHLYRPEGRFAADVLVGRTGAGTISNTNDEKYGPQSKFSKFLAPTGKVAPAPDYSNPSVSKDEDDDLPF